MFGTASEEGIAVVESGQNKGANGDFGGIFGKVVTYGADSAEFEVAGSVDGRDVLIKGQSLVKDNA